MYEDFELLGDSRDTRSSMSVGVIPFVTELGQVVELLVFNRSGDDPSGFGVSNNPMSIGLSAQGHG